MKKQFAMAGWFFLFIFVFTVVPAVAGVLPDTGQTRCYDADGNVLDPCPQPGEPFYGQDAQYQGPRSYTKLDAGGNALPDTASEWVMVRDNVTGLIWEVKTDDGTIHDKDKKFHWYDSNPATNGGFAGYQGNYTYPDTELFIERLNARHFGGYNDWRLPNMMELDTLVRSNCSNPTVNIDFFPNISSSAYQCYWSSITHVLSNTAVWVVDFSNGTHQAGGKERYSNSYARAVRGQPLESPIRYFDNGDGTVTDAVTGLMWQQASSYNGDWQQALAYCENLELAGYSDWRLPNRNELVSQVDYTRTDPTIDTDSFPDTKSHYYWSSTTANSSNDTAWMVNFHSGLVGYDTHYYWKYGRYYVRAVRSGSPNIIDSINNYCPLDILDTLDLRQNNPIELHAVVQDLFLHKNDDQYYIDFEKLETADDIGWSNSVKKHSTAINNVMQNNLGLVSPWYDANWQNLLPVNEEFNDKFDTVYMASNNNLNEDLEVISHVDEITPVDATTNLNSYFFRYRSLNTNENGQSADLNEWVQYVKNISDHYGKKIKRLTIFAHGSPGRVIMSDNFVFSSLMSADEIDKIKELREVLADDAVILLFSCNVGKDEVGRDFVMNFADWTNATVYANTQKAGPVDYDKANKLIIKDWDLDVIGIPPDYSNFTEYSTFVQSDIDTTLLFPSGAVVTIPKNALSEDASLEIKRVDPLINDSGIDLMNPPAESVYEITFHGGDNFSINGSIEVVFPYDPMVFSEIANSTVMFWDENEMTWSDDGIQEVSFNDEGRYVTFTTNHTTIFAVLDLNDIDNDGDGFSENEGDCDDNDPSINPGAEEICGDGIDNNCDGQIDEGCTVLGDLDADGDIDTSDFMIFRSTLGKCEGTVGFIPEADYDGDGCITYADYRIWYGYYRNQ